MHRALTPLADASVDVLVVGGGIHGVWAARSAVRRGLSVALVEAEDFAAGTSSRSTMLAHGGLRYLEHYDFGLVREALRERGKLTRMAPHLVRPIPFLLPFYEGAPFPKWQLKMGIRLYSLLALGSGYPHHRFLSKRQVLALEPGLREEGLKGGAVYWDGQILSPERLTAIVARDAFQRGAQVVNHARVDALEETRGANRVEAEIEDPRTGHRVNLDARTVVNTTGPYLDRFLDEVGLTDDRLRLTKGVHIGTPPFTDHAVVINANDGRTFFTIPWHEHQLIGTTDTDYADDPHTVHATQHDVHYLQDSVNHYFPDAPTDKVRFTNAGLRNLINEEGVPPGSVTRQARIHAHEDEGLPNMVSLIGGKLTTARATGEHLIDAIRHRVDAPREGHDPHRLPGGSGALQGAYRQARRVCRSKDLLPGVAERLVRLYGSEWRNVAGAGLEPLTEEDGLLRGEARFAVEQEMARSVEDVVRRRTLGWVTPKQGLDAASAVANELVGMGVPSEQANASVRAWEQTVSLHRSWRDEAREDRV